MYLATALDRKRDGTRYLFCGKICLVISYKTGIATNVMEVKDIPNTILTRAYDVDVVSILVDKENNSFKVYNFNPNKKEIGTYPIEKLSSSIQKVKKNRRFLYLTELKLDENFYQVLFVLRRCS